MSTETTKGYAANTLNGWAGLNTYQDITELSGNLDMSASPGRYAQRLRIDPGAARDVTMWTASETPGLMVNIINSAGAAETITLKESAADGGSTIGTIEQNREVEIWSDGSSWAFVKKSIITLS